MAGGGGDSGRVMNVGVIARGQGKGSRSRSCGNQLRHGVRGGPACLRGKQMFSPGGVPSLQSNLQRLGGQVLNRGGWTMRGASTGHFGGKRFNFDTTTY